MLTPYLVLDVRPDASDDEIREAYLAAVRAASHDPDRLARCGRAYELLRDLRSRVRNELLGALDMADLEDAVAELVAAARPRRETVRLADLVAAESRAGRGDGADGRG